LDDDNPIGTLIAMFTLVAIVVAMVLWDYFVR